MASRRNIKTAPGSWYCTVQLGSRILLEKRFRLPGKQSLILPLIILITFVLFYIVTAGSEDTPAAHTHALTNLSDIIEKNQVLLMQSSISQQKLIENRFGRQLEPTYLNEVSQFSDTPDPEEGRGGAGGPANLRVLPRAYHAHVHYAHALASNSESFINFYDFYLKSYPHGWPLSGVKKVVNSKYGYRKAPLGRERGQRKFHKGIDLKAAKGVPVLAMAAGKVHVARDSLYGYGRQIRIVHDSGYETLYAHLSHINVQEHDIVQPGDIIGFVGSTGFSTGPHLHLEVRLNSKHLNPAGFLDKE